MEHFTKTLEGLGRDSKYLGGNKLENCQLTHRQVFRIVVSSQIAHLSLSLTIIRYNLLASIKRTLDDETIGALFNDVYEGVHELTVIDNIWEIILKVVAVVAEMMDIDY